MWRPPDWKKGYNYYSYEESFIAYEDGADAMIRALLNSSDAFYTPGMVTASDNAILNIPLPNKKGVWVHIPI